MEDIKASNEERAEKTKIENKRTLSRIIVKLQELVDQNTLLPQKPKDAIEREFHKKIEELIEENERKIEEIRMESSERMDKTMAENDKRAEKVRVENEERMERLRKEIEEKQSRLIVKKVCHLIENSPSGK